MTDKYAVHHVRKEHIKDVTAVTNLSAGSQFQTCLWYQLVVGPKLQSHSS